MFIIVTHNKRTMVKANRIFGVTMEETGVSRVLPVDLTTLNLN
jgi:chromosome segregation protein